MSRPSTLFIPFTSAFVSDIPVFRSFAIFIPFTSISAMPIFKSSTLSASFTFAPSMLVFGFSALSTPFMFGSFALSVTLVSTFAISMSESSILPALLHLHLLYICLGLSLYLLPLYICLLCLGLLFPLRWLCFYHLYIYQL